jgi:beta-N-acetylhexosaminidase
VGETLGSELHTLGFNLFLGPSLDVLDINYTGSGDDLGTRTFGGDPFWVSQMGRAYIQGLHNGGNNQLAVIAKNFPGRGGSDRPPESEVATVRKSLDQLKLIELVPFFSVTGNAKDSSETTDGLLLSHIRYQGLQGNIRATTKPVSLDPGALDVLMKLPELATWRSNGGLIVSDDLGSQAVRLFFDPTGKSFDARQVVRNAFLAGNDLLYMDHILSTGDPDSNTTILHILDFFTQKYQDDPAFADRVDESDIRILTLKYRMYPTFDSRYVLPKAQGLVTIGNSNEISFEVARKAVTLISPGSKDLSTTLPRPPGTSDNIVFFTDVLNSNQCNSCKPQADFGVDEFQKIVSNLYGPSAGGQILPNHLSSYSFTDLVGFLDSPINHLDIQSDLTKADWLIFSILNIDPNRPESNVLQRILAERPDLIQQKKVIVFAFNTPYRLDATDISTATAYYGIYSKIPAFVEIAARVLFQEINPTGASPVSIPGVAYDLSTVTSPEPNQVIPLVIDVEKISKPSITSAQPTPTPTFFIGDVLPLKTGVILDHNGHPVPDGTVVKFYFNLTGDKLMSQQTDAVVVNGIARTTFHIQDPGLLEIHASSDPANNSDILLLDISVGKSVVVSAITPTMVPLISEQPVSIPDVQKTTFNPIKSSSISPIEEWLIILFVLWVFALIMIWVGNYFISLQWGLRAGLTAVIFGLTAYLWILLGLPGSSFYYNPNGLGLTILIVLLSSVVGILIQYLLRNKSLIK